MKSELFTDADLEAIRWQFSLLGNYCGALRYNGTVCMATRHKKGGRCKFHKGCKGPTTREGRRSMVISKLTKLDKRSKLPTDIFTEEEMGYYDQVRDFIKDNYQVEDELVINQISKLLVYQNIIMQKLRDGFNADPTLSSNCIRNWLSEYKLTPKSKGLDIDTSELGVGGLARIIQEVWAKKHLEEAEEVQAEEIQAEE